nr:YqzM family protein [Lederbergia wuyishanensis]
MNFVYTIVEIGGVVVNKFEQNVQSKRNDAVDSGVGFAVSFVFFTAIFVIGTVIELLGK